MSDFSPLHAVMIEPIVRAALLEDLGRAGDVTSSAIIPPNLTTNLTLTAREPGVVAGLDVATLAFQLVEPTTKIEVHRFDGSEVAAEEKIATISGSARGLLPPSGLR